MKTQILEKLITDKAVDHFMCRCLSSHSMSLHWEGTVLPVISPVPLTLSVWGEVSGTGSNAVVIMLQATQWTLLRMFSGNAGRKWYNILAILPTSFHMS